MKHLILFLLLTFRFPFASDFDDPFFDHGSDCGDYIEEYESPVWDENDDRIFDNDHDRELKKIDINSEVYETKGSIYSYEEVGKEYYLYSDEEGNKYGLSFFENNKNWNGQLWVRISGELKLIGNILKIKDDFIDKLPEISLDVLFNHLIPHFYPYGRSNRKDIKKAYIDTVRHLWKTLNPPKKNESEDEVIGKNLLNNEVQNKDELSRAELLEIVNQKLVRFTHHIYPHYLKKQVEGFNQFSRSTDIYGEDYDENDIWLPRMDLENYDTHSKTFLIYDIESLKSHINKIKKSNIFDNLSTEEQDAYTFFLLESEIIKNENWQEKIQKIIQAFTPNFSSFRDSSEFRDIVAQFCLSGFYTPEIIGKVFTIYNDVPSEWESIMKTFGVNKLVSIDEYGNISSKKLDCLKICFKEIKDKCFDENTSCNSFLEISNYLILANLYTQNHVKAICSIFSNKQHDLYDFVHLCYFEKFNNPECLNIIAKIYLMYEDFFKEECSGPYEVINAFIKSKKNTPEKMENVLSEISNQHFQYGYELTDFIKSFDQKD